jgi:N-hydroxyarylamine O-acetyltransferase
MAARPIPGGRYGLFNNQLTLHPLNGQTEQRRLGSADEIRAVLQTHFGLRVPANPVINEALARLTA